MVNNKFKIVLATSNPHKVEEMNAIFEELNSQSSKPLSLQFVLPPEGFDPDETGSTFEENSYIKAKEANRLTGLMTLADDSGLCVEALNGAPGLHSARYADTPQGRIDKLLKELEPHSNRKAKFVCAMTLLNENGEIMHQTLGECHGEISRKQFGTQGFGYDPVFIIEGTNRTMAEMSEEEKNTLSHRAAALRNIFDFLHI